MSDQQYILTYESGQSLYSGRNEASFEGCTAPYMVLMIGLYHHVTDPGECSLLVRY